MFCASTWQNGQRRWPLNDRVPGRKGREHLVARMLAARIDRTGHSVLLVGRIVRTGYSEFEQ
jgi:hypothetical protein